MRSPPAAAKYARELAREIEGRTAAVYARLLDNARAAGTVDPALDPKAFAFFLDNLFMMLQFSFSCEYYRERMAIFLGKDSADEPEKNDGIVYALHQKCIKNRRDRLVCDCV